MTWGLRVTSWCQLLPIGSATSPRLSRGGMGTDNLGDQAARVSCSNAEEEIPRLPESARNDGIFANGLGDMAAVRLLRYVEGEFGCHAYSSPRSRTALKAKVRVLRRRCCAPEAGLYLADLRGSSSKIPFSSRLTGIGPLSVIVTQTISSNCPASACSALAPPVVASL